MTRRKKDEEASSERDTINRTLLNNPADSIFLINQYGTVLDANETMSERLGRRVADVIGVNIFDLLPPEVAGYRKAFVRNVIETGKPCRFEDQRQGAWFDHILIPVFDDLGTVVKITICSRDITERKKAEDALLDTLEESRRREKEILAMQKSSHAVLTCRKFENSVCSIFDCCKNLIGAQAGYVALLSKDGHENKVLFLDVGGLPCPVDPSLPMPVRGLPEKAYQTGKAVYHNGFQDSEWMRFMPEGHVRLDNVLFSPLVIEGETVGLLGLANKQGGFTEDDALTASAFGELAAIALLNSRTLEEVENSEERFRSVVETANDAIITINSRGAIVSWNSGAERIFGYSSEEAHGSQILILIPERFREFHENAVNRALSKGGLNLTGMTVELVALKKDGSEFPIELSSARWKTADGIFFTGIIRDVTERRRMEEKLKKAKEDLEIKVQERMKELQSAVGLLQKEVNERKEAEKTILFYQEQLRALMSKLSVAEEQERRRISEHIHDNISQNLAMSKMNIEALQEEFPPAAKELKETRELIEQTIKFIRSLTFELSPPILYELGFNAAVEWLTEKVRDRYGIIIELKSDSRFKTLKGEISVLLFRTIRELLNNIIKHSKAKNAIVSIQGFGDYMEIRIEDDGIGFAASEKNGSLFNGESFGIPGIRERIRYLNGSWEIISGHGEGTRIKIVVPLYQ
jgi:PAS domain S-box-containing protein